MSDHATAAATYRQTVLAFSSHGLKCAASLFEPLGEVPPGPCIVMAGGLGSIRAVGLPPYARAFAARGYRVLSFDYRYWGDSEGEPRHLIAIPRQLEDWAAAIAFARGLRGVNPSKVALWGTSMSGGHVVSVAAEDPTVAAISAQCPMMDGRAASLRHLRYAGPLPALKLASLGVVDLVRSALGLSPQRVLISGSTGELALMSSADTREGVDRLYAEAGLTRGGKRAPARVALSLGRYRPIAKAAEVRCPALIIACDNDSVAPVAPAAAAARAMGPQAELVTCAFTHFGIYVGEGFTFSFGRQLQHFDRVFGRPAPGSRVAVAPLG